MTSQSKQRLDVFTNFEKKCFVHTGNLNLIVGLSVKVLTSFALKDVFEFSMENVVSNIRCVNF